MWNERLVVFYGTNKTIINQFLVLSKISATFTEYTMYASASSYVQKLIPPLKHTPNTLIEKIGDLCSIDMEPDILTIYMFIERAL